MHCLFCSATNLVTVLKNQRQLLFAVQDIVEAHNVGMVKLFEQRNLAHRVAGHSLAG